MIVNFITLDDVNDEIVECQQADVDKANRYLLNIARKLGVNEARIKTPPVYNVEQLGIFYALYICCIRSIGKDNLPALDTESTRQDIYAQKAKFFKAEIERIEKTICADDFEVKKNGGFGDSFCVPVWRA